MILGYGVAVQMQVVAVVFIVAGALLAWGSRRRKWARAIRVGAFTFAFALIMAGIAMFHAAYRVPGILALQAAEGRLSAVGAGLLAYQSSEGCLPSTLGVLVDSGSVMRDGLRSIFRASPSRTGIDYVYVSGLGADDPGTWPVAFDLHDTHPDQKRLVLFLSGEVRTLTKEQFRAMRSAFEAEHTRKKGVPPEFVGEDTR